MSDPLSVAAGVIGLLAVAAQVSLILTEIVSKALQVPRECQIIRTDVEDIRNVLVQLQLYTTGVKQAPRWNRALIMVDQVAATLASCVLSFDELKMFVEGLQRESTTGVLDHSRWVTKRSDFEDHQSRLGIHKSSLTLMLTILNRYDIPVFMKRRLTHRHPQAKSWMMQNQRLTSSAKSWT